MGRLTGMVWCLLVVRLLSLPVGAAESGAKKDAELSWAKGVAEDFLGAAFAGHGEQAQSLIDSSLKSAFAKQGDHRLGEWLNNSIAIHRFRDPIIEKEDIAPDEDEALFRGTFQAKQQPMQFTLRVVKDKETNRWRVSYFQFRDQDKKN